MNSPRGCGPRTPRTRICDVGPANPAAAQDYPSAACGIIHSVPPGGSKRCGGALDRHASGASASASRWWSTTAAEPAACRHRVVAKSQATATRLGSSPCARVNPWLYKLSYDPIKISRTWHACQGRERLVVHPSCR